MSRTDIKRNFQVLSIDLAIRTTNVAWKNDTEKWEVGTYTLSLCPISWIKLAACCRFDSSFSASMPHLRDGESSNRSLVKYHRLCWRPLLAIDGSWWLNAASLRRLGSDVPEYSIPFLIKQQIPYFMIISRFGTASYWNSRMWTIWPFLRSNKAKIELGAEEETRSEERVNDKVLSLDS